LYNILIKPYNDAPVLTVMIADVALTFFRSLKTSQLTFLRMRDICKIVNVQRKDKAFMV